MNKLMLRIAILILFPLGIYCQAGIQFYGGINYAENRSEIITPQGFSHSGYYYGLDVRLNDGNMYFGGGLELTKVNFLAMEEKSFLSVKNSMNWFKLRFGLGYTIFNLDNKFIGRLKTYGSINMITSYPEDMIEAPYLNYNSGVAGAVVGLGLDILFFTVDVEYEHGFFNAVNKVSGTEFDFYKLSLGFRI